MKAAAYPLLALLAISACRSGPACAIDYHVSDRDVAGLASAIEHSNASPGADTLHLARNGLYSLSRPHSHDLALPPIQGELRVLGNGAEIRRNTSQPLALIEIGSDGVVDMDSLTLAEGSRGTLRNHGVLRITRSAIVDATTLSESAIVLNHGDLTISESVIGFNQVTGAGRDAGIVLNYGTLRLNDSTLAENSLARRYPSIAAAPIVNFGSVLTRGLALRDNTILDDFEGLASTAVLNLGIGHSGEH